MTKEDVIEILERFVIGAKPCSQREIVYACASAYRMLKEQPSVPSNLDEAADTFNREDAARMWDYEGKTEGEIVEAAFKAGAEWMAGQGVSVDGKVIMDFSEPYDIINRRLIAKLGDALLEIEPGEVVVQIRKK